MKMNYDVMKMEAMGELMDRQFELQNDGTFHRYYDSCYDENHSYGLPPYDDYDEDYASYKKHVLDFEDYLAEVESYNK